ncbi:MAG: hypothetical protein NC217_07010 [Muribaculaceae bacterium]|nr:hypothetical protein [Muribaculaceae bacterium]
MKKYIFAALAVMAASFSASAQDDYTLLVNTNAGNTVEFAFKYYPVATFDGDEVVISSDNNAEDMRYNMGDIASFTFKKTTGLQSVNTADIRVKVTKEFMTVEGLEPNADVKIYNANGATVAAATANAEGYVYIDLTGMGAGVFVATMPGNTFKFIR